MHSFEAPLYTTFHFNSDLSGIVTIESPDPGQTPVHTSYDDIRAFYLEMKRSRLVAKIENMDYDELELM